MAPGMVGFFPARVYYRAFPDLDDAVASPEADFPGRINDFHMRPLIAVMMDIIGDFAKEYPFRL